MVFMEHKVKRRGWSVGQKFGYKDSVNGFEPLKGSH